MRLEVFDLDPATYRPHALHGADRNWSETNCWFDMMIELLHVLGLDPMAGLPGVLSTDFEGEHWTLPKYPLEDLRALFGLEVAEMYIWRPVIDHLADHLAQGHLLTVEVDAWYLPDTAGITYGIDHGKTGVLMQMLDRENRRLGYFHNGGYFELEGDDFDAIFYLPGGRDMPEGRDPRILFPYVELVKLDRIRHDDEATLLDAVLTLVRHHLGLRPATNPMVRFRARLESDIEWLRPLGDSAFHPYAFATCRQAGANQEVAASFVDWLDQRDGGGLQKAADAFREIAATAKGLEFTLARAVRGRKVDLATPFGIMADAWEVAMETLVARYGS
ncbi:MAG TPA: DUF1839 family protein [Acidimicrobiales bacterium]|jgi:hypothetical protein